MAAGAVDSWTTLSRPGSLPSLLSLPYEILDSIYALLSLSSRASLASTCRALRHPSPPFSSSYDALFQEPGNSDEKFHLFCMGERDGCTSTALLACYACRKAHAKEYFRGRKVYRRGLRRKCIGTTDKLTLRPGASVNYEIFIKDLNLGCPSGTVVRGAAELLEGSASNVLYARFHNRCKQSSSPGDLHSDGNLHALPPVYMHSRGAVLSCVDGEVCSIVQYNFPARAVLEPEALELLEAEGIDASTGPKSGKISQTWKRKTRDTILKAVSSGLKRTRLDYHFCPHSRFSTTLQCAEDLLRSDFRCSKCHSTSQFYLCRSKTAVIEECHVVPEESNGLPLQEQSSSGSSSSRGESDQSTAFASLRQSLLSMHSSRASQSQAALQPSAAASRPGQQDHAETRADEDTSGPLVTWEQRTLTLEELGPFMFTFHVRRELGSCRDPTDLAWLQHLDPPDASHL